MHSGWGAVGRGTTPRDLHVPGDAGSVRSFGLVQESAPSARSLGPSAPSLGASWHQGRADGGGLARMGISELGRQWFDQPVAMGLDREHERGIACPGRATMGQGRSRSRVVRSRAATVAQHTRKCRSS